MPRIRTLLPNVTHEQAVEELSSATPVGLVRNVVFGRLRSVAAFYIPFRFFQVEIINRGIRHKRLFGIDAVTGTLDLYEFEDLPGPEEVQYIETRNCPDVLLDDARASELVINKVRRLLFTTGFFRIRDLHITSEAVAGEIYIPYWVGFRGRGVRARVSIMDAMRRRLEGAKVRHLLRDWLTAVAVKN